MGENSAVSDQKMNTSSEKPVDRITNVYVWDMDETLILLKSLLNGAYAEASNGLKDMQKGVEIGKMWENHILELSDKLFFYEEIEDYNKPYLDALSQYDDGRDLSDYNFNQDGFSTLNNGANKRKLAYRHRIIANKYKQGLHNLLDQDKKQLLHELYDLTDEYTDKWLSSARTFLKWCSWGKEDTSDHIISGIETKPDHINVLVTSGSLIPSLIKCLVFRLDSFITYENVYSSWEVGKTQCFQWIKERFSGPKVRFCAIGDGWEECEAAQALQWPFVKIDLRPGSPYRFPGLRLKTLDYYFAVVYPENSED